TPDHLSLHDALPISVAVVPARALGGLPVTRVLDALAATRGLPQMLRTDNGLEFCGRAMLTWAHTRGVQLRLIEPGKPTQNAYIRSEEHTSELQSRSD